MRWPSKARQHPDLLLLINSKVRLSDLENLDQSGVTTGRFLLDSPLILPLLFFTRGRQSFFVAILLWALRRPAPLQKKSLDYLV